MRFALFFCFLFVITSVASFDFDVADDKNSKDNNVVSSIEIFETTVASTVAVIPVFNTTAATASTTTQPTTTTTQPTTTTTQPTTSTSTTTQPTTTTTQQTTSTSTTPDQGPLGREVPSVIEEKTRSEKIEVIISQSIYRLIDEAFRERLINFESRIASLLHKRQKIETEIDDFIEMNDFLSDDFFSDVFKEKERYSNFTINNIF